MVTVAGQVQLLEDQQSSNNNDNNDIREKIRRFEKTDMYARKGIG